MWTDEWGKVRECLDHVIVLSASGLDTILTEFVAYYNSGRAHQSLDRMQPVPRPRRTEGQVQARRVLGGLHHVYSRAAEAGFGNLTLPYQRSACVIGYPPARGPAG